MKRLISNTASTAAAVLIALPAWSEDTRYVEATQAVQKAESLQVDGRWKDALALLNEQMQRCGAEESAKPCRQLTRYALGYVSDTQASSSHPADPKLLQAAAEQYQAVLADAPDHEATLQNLAQVLRKLDRPTDAERVLQQAVKADRSGTGFTSLLLGNFYLDTGRAELALDSFKRAIAINPAAGAPRRAVVDAYRALPVTRSAELLPLLREWEAPFIDVSELGYRQVADAAIDTAPALAEASVQDWVMLLARRGRITPRTIGSFHPTWAPMKDLHAYLGRPQQRPAASSWWMQSPRHRSTLAAVALDARDFAPASSPAEVVMTLEQAMQFCPGYENYMFDPSLRGQWPVRLELARQLFALYYAAPELDPNERKRQDLIGELFMGKSNALGSGDLELIQRFHTTLGLIYAELGQWKSGNGYMDAQYQLSHALQAAARREQQTGYYQPLQELKARLAQGYEKLDRPKDARSLYLEAAQAYLDTDQTARAQEMLEAAERLDTSLGASERDRVAALRTITRTREEIAALGKGGSGFSGFARKPAQAWLYGSVAPLAEPFVLRQQFKSLADVASSGRSLGAPAAPEAEQHALRAFDVAGRMKAMVGTADLIRFETVKEIATSHVQLPRSSGNVDGVAPQQGYEGKSWPLYVPAEARPFYVKASADTLLAARLTSFWKNDTSISAMPLSFSIEDGNVRLVYAGKDKEGEIARNKLSNVQGVRSMLY